LETLLNIKQAAAFLNLSPLTLRTWTGAKRIPFVKLGRAVRFRLSDLEAFIARSAIPPRNGDRRRGGSR